MHAYLIVGDNELTQKETEKLIKKLKTRRIDFSIGKIAEVRELGGFVKLSINEPTSIVINNVDSASQEALNAFLKNLEEPQKNIYYILCANSVYNLPSTIISRCQITKTSTVNRKGNKKLAQQFVNMSIGQKFNYLESYKKREDAINFIRELVLGVHKLLLEDMKNYSYNAKVLKSAQSTLSALKANGNVTLQLTNFVVNVS
jgi:DNA polymerase III delta prime subunit